MISFSFLLLIEYVLIIGAFSQYIAWFIKRLPLFLINLATLLLILYKN